MSLLPPSKDQEFTSREAMLESLQSHARGHGYAVTTRWYNARDGALYLKCDRGGEYKPGNGLTATNRRPDTGTRLIDCPCSLRANFKNGVWTIKVRNPDHNHEGISNNLSHPMQRRMPDNVKKQVEIMFTSGSKPREIISAIRQISDHSVVSHDIYNVRGSLKLKNLAGKTPIEALIVTLKEGLFKFDYQTDTTG